ncbi:MAG: EAL domain-containing protein [Rhodopseudomonas sp.]|nr:EAL domain-containing protein [Rhodopseudomonas sp.]
MEVLKASLAKAGWPDLLAAGPYGTLWLAVIVIGVVCMLAALIKRWIGPTRIDEASLNAAHLREQNEKFGIALNSMSQGVVMFDAGGRATLWNERYLEVARLDADFMATHPTLLEVLQLRQKRGTFPLPIDRYCNELRADVASGKTKTVTYESDCGRYCYGIIVPLPGGGWVTTQEDITARVTAKRVIETQKLHLDVALDNMPEGLSMFDRNQRLIVCNRQYTEMYGLTDALSRPGAQLRDILHHWGMQICPPDELENYVATRVAAAERKSAYQIVNQLSDGRYIAVSHRPMSDGGWVSTHTDITDAKRREESFRMLFDGSPIPMWAMDRRTLRFLAVNEAAIAHYGFSREQFLSMTIPDLRLTEERQEFTAFLRGLSLSDSQVGERVAKHRKADGTIIDVEIFSRAMIYEGRSARLAAINDITKTKHATDELRRTRKFLDAVIEHVPLPIVVRDVSGLQDDARNGRFFLFNRAYEELTGDKRVDLIGKTAEQIYDPERAALVVSADNEAMASDRAVVVPEHAIQTRGHRTRLVTGKKTVIRDDKGRPQYLLTVLDDITDSRRADERIAYLARNDSLTGLANRATFVERLDQVIADAAQTGESFAILCADLDSFKAANDVYGHLVGDRLLHEAASRLHAASAGQFVARVGGDEFTLIVTGGAQPDSALAISERLLAAFDPYFDVDGHRLKLGLSIGGAIYPVDGHDATTLIANADAALYQAKAEARGSLRLFDAKLAACLHARREMQMDLQVAVARQQFVLHYQPQAKVGDGEIVGFESLVRWQCPVRGLVPPGEFIPIVEQSDLIVPLGNWILHEACREAASWAKPLKIAVNISPVQFHAGDLAAEVHLALLESGLAPNRLELEITEGVLIDDFSHAVSVLRKLKLLGVQIAMDDFGSGYSSLSYLHSFGFDKIKIDRSFIRDLNRSHHAMAIVRAIISLGHSLDVPVLAEGVETDNQRDFLAQEGCDDMQGYLIGRPMPIESYAEVVGRCGQVEPRKIGFGGI